MRRRISFRYEDRHLLQCTKLMKMVHCLRSSMRFQQKYQMITRLRDMIKNNREMHDEPKTRKVVNHLYNLGIRDFQDRRFQTNERVSCLPVGYA